MTAINEQQFLEMDDRERDAWVEQNIMGVDVNISRTTDGRFVGADRLDDYENPDVPTYSTDYNAMMRVIEKMRGDGFEFRCLAKDLSTAWFWVPMGEEREFSARHEDLRLAVSLAAGRALGVIDA
jgi:hypothetical protein